MSGATEPKATTPAERRKKLRENQEYFSEKLSDLMRYIGFGLVAASFSLLSRATAFAEKLSERADSLLALAALFGCLIVVADALQMLAGWQSNSLAAENKAEEYRMTGPAKRWRKVQLAMFYGKQILASVGSLLLITAIMMGISLPALVG